MLVVKMYFHFPIAGKSIGKGTSCSSCLVFSGVGGRGSGSLVLFSKK